MEFLDTKQIRSSIVTFFFRLTVREEIDFNKDVKARTEEKSIRPSRITVN